MRLHQSFIWDNKEWMASIAKVDEYGNECMVFPVINDEVDYGYDCYCKRDIPFTRQALEECITDFRDNYTGKELEYWGE